MQTRTHNPFTTIHTEGALLPTDLLQRVLAVDRALEGLSPADYHLPAGEKLNEAINHSWNRLQGSWAAFRRELEKLPARDFGTTLTRERWLLPLFQELGYGRLLTSKAIELDGKSYPISHRWGDTPIHLVGCGIELDRRTAGAAGASRSSPHSLLQELLNRSTEVLWGLLSNGLRLRVLRDNASLTRQAFLEFDLEAMFEGEVYADFAVLWLICHQSRVESREKKVVNCWLETWSKAAQEQGTRALDSLRQGVEGAISVFGSGFLRHPTNQKLREDLRSGKLDTQEYYRQLLRLVYRLIFLFVAEERDLLFDPGSSPQARQRYLLHYSLSRLRRLAERSRGGRHPDLYAMLKLVTDILGGRTDSVVGKTGLGLPVLGGFLFADKALGDLESADLDNESLLTVIRHLTLMDEGRTRRAVDYKNLGSEELGSIYESLLELHPLINADAATFELTSVSGSERKTTGSYFTPSSLIQVLLDSALEPVIEEAVEKASRQDAKIAKETDQKENLASLAALREKALLDLKICDPACGSGHFLVAAAHRLARRLAAVRTGEGEPAPEAMHTALRAVISNCIYGVDINPMSVELCKVSLWMEALEPGKPLSFLDAHIRCGDSLVGVSPNLDISEIPDEAFNPAFGDDKATASAVKKRNKRERGGQFGLFGSMRAESSSEDTQQWLAEKAAQVDAMPEDDPEQVLAKAEAFAEMQQADDLNQKKLEYNLWTAAFFWHIPKTDAETMLAPTQQALVSLRAGSTLKPNLLDNLHKLAKDLNFLHWELVFPKVFAGDNPGFDCVLGNPPWELLQLEEQEYFASLNPEIANLPGDQRKKAIADLEKNDPSLAFSFEQAKHYADANNKFLRYSGCYPLTTNGKLNTYAIFAEGFRKLLSLNGHAGIIVPTGISTDHSTRFFFQDLVEKRNLISLYDFENGQGIFPAVERNVRFCLLSMSIKQQDRILISAQLRSTDEMRNKGKVYRLSANDIMMINPNTKNCPMFCSNQDAQIVAQIHRHIPVLVNIPISANPWAVQFRQGLFNMTSDSNLFKTIENLTEKGFQLIGNTFIGEDCENYLPLYESKLIHQYNHRAATFLGTPILERFKIHAGTKVPSKIDFENPDFQIIPRYWVPENKVINFTDKNRKWFLGFRNAISATADSRSLVATIVPWSGIGNSMPIMFVSGKPSNSALILGMLNSIVLDYILKQKASGGNLNFYIVEQLPFLTPDAFNSVDIDFITTRVVELVYTAYDLKPFAEDMGYHGEPFTWDEERRALLRAELDAYYARLYGLTRDELRYILDPKEVYGEDFPGETFRVLKEKEIKLNGEFRTRRLVLEAWDKLEGVTVEGYHAPEKKEVKHEINELPVTVTPPKDQPANKTPTVMREPEPEEESPAQPMLSDFGMYRCQACGKMVMGFEKESHLEEEHRGVQMEWNKVR